MGRGGEANGFVKKGRIGNEIKKGDTIYEKEV